MTFMYSIANCTLLTLRMLHLNFAHLTFSLIRIFWLFFRLIIWKINGNFKYLNDFETSAQVERIIKRSKKTFLETIKLRHFIGYLVGFEHPNIVLKDNVILLSVSDTTAYFLEMKKTLHHYTVDKVPFCFITLFEDALNLISMPISSFHRIAEYLGPMSEQSLIISHPVRTGSTLLCKLIQLSSKRVLALSEPDALAHLSDLQLNKKITDQEFNRIVKSTLRLLFKPVTNVDAVVIKERGETIRLQKIISQICPEIQHVFIDRRNKLKVVQSFLRTYDIAFKPTLMNFLLQASLLKIFIGSSLFNYRKETVHVYQQGFKFLNMKNPYEFCICRWATFYKPFIDTKQFVEFTILYYEDLLTFTEEEIKKVYKLLKIEPESLQKALNFGLKEDSQKDTPFSQKTTSAQQSLEYSGDVKRRGNIFLDSLNIPRFCD